MIRKNKVHYFNYTFCSKFEYYFLPAGNIGTNFAYYRNMDVCALADSRFCGSNHPTRYILSHNTDLHNCLNIWDLCAEKTHSNAHGVDQLVLFLCPYEFNNFY